MRKLSVLVLLLVAVPCLGECITAWGYQGTKGPEYWGTLEGGRWRVCAAGISQSPINISTPRREDRGLSAVTLAGTGMFDVNNTGPAVKLTPRVTGGQGWTVQWNGETGTLQEFHVHVPAEHLDNGVRHKGEIHFVYALPDGRILALGVWIDQRPTVNTTLQRIIDKKPAACGGHNELGGTLAIGAFGVNWQHYAVYRGSLTTPPCTENVTFVLALDPIFATAGQLAALKLVPIPTGNARPFQWIKVKP